MERQEALLKLSELIGKDLRLLADQQYEVTVFPEGKRNKCWAGYVLERHLNLPINSSQSPNFGSWELKIVLLKCLNSARLTVKETMA